VQLSILIATNRRGLLACSRIAQACSWAGPDLEVIVRDNSGDPQKRELLAHFRGEHRNIIIAEPCDGLTNFSELLRTARGDFVFLLADDDFCFDHAVAAVPALLDQHGRDPAVAGVTGAYAVETSQGSAIVSYQNVESDDVALRVAGFLSYNGPNILHYAPVRRDIVQRVFAFMNTLPFYFSFHDQIVCLLYLLNGKFVRLSRFLYLYDVGPWEEFATAQKRDVDFYRDAGLDPVINKLHWFLCGFEGANLIRNADLFPDYPLGLRQVIADRWFSTMFLRFKNQGRTAFESRFAGDVEKLCAKFQASAGQLTFQDMLTDISGFFALFSKPQAQTYYEFWDAVLNRRAPPLRPPAVTEKRRRGTA
jgi:Glycosyl transferase family 2